MHAASLVHLRFGPNFYWIVLNVKSYNYWIAKFSGPGVWLRITHLVGLSGAEAFF